MQNVLLSDDTLGALLEKGAQLTPEKNFITYADRGLYWSYEQFNNRVDEFARGLMAVGVTKGTKVGIWANNVPDWLTVFFACAKIGAWLVTINTNFKIGELEYLLTNADIHTLCMIDQYRGSSYVDMIYELAPEIKTTPKNETLQCKRLPELRNVVLLSPDHRKGMYNTVEILGHARFISPEQYEEAKASVNCQDVVNMQYTSGTTGYPKAVMLTHHNIVNNGWATGECMKYTSVDRLLVCVPFFHCFGIVLAVCSIVTHGASMVICEDFDVPTVLYSIEREHCTSLYGVPTMFSAELNHPNLDKYDLSSLRTGIMAGSVCPVETMKGVMEKMYMKDIISVYGLTESSPGMTASRTEHTMEQRTTTVGTEYPCVEVKVFNPETGEECGINEPGEICCRGYNIMRGYYKNEEATNQIIDKDGWLHSGDLAIKDADGFYHITGRIKDMIIRGGENIYPREIENYIYRMPEVNMVEVVGVPDEHYGENVAAFIILKDGCHLTEDEVRLFCTKQLAKFKVPKHVFFVKDYPKTGSGKVQKFKLREIGRDLVEELKRMGKI
ncbi:MAG: AMP-binding protein [Bacteroidales bacterium]|nr:AMP-binding protein [Bacteroidales bacterium]